MGPAKQHSNTPQEFKRLQSILCTSTSDNLDTMPLLCCKRPQLCQTAHLMLLWDSDMLAITTKKQKTNHKVRLRTNEWTVMTNHLINIYHSSVQAINLSRFLSRQEEEIQTGWYVLLILVKELVDGLTQINSHNNGLLHKALLYPRLAAIWVTRSNTIVFLLNLHVIEVEHLTASVLIQKANQQVPKLMVWQK